MSCGSFRFLCATLATSFFVAAIAARGGVLREQAGDFGVEDRPSLLRQDYAPNWPLSSSGNEDRIAATVHLELPELTIVYTNGEVVLQWPLLTSDWALEQSSVLHPTAWFSVPLTSARTN